MEIKFRGKRTDNGEWAFGDVIQAGNGRRFIGNGAHVTEVDPKTVGQFTTKKDSNKTEIYRGDILLITDEYGGCYMTPVRFDDGGFIVDVDGEDYDLTTIGWAIDKWDNECSKWEVVGNIWDNPGLLEKKATEEDEDE